MKGLLLYILILVSGVSYSYSQQYHPMLRENRYWDVHTAVPDFSQLHYDDYYDRYYIKGDSLIDTILYKKVYDYGISGNGPVNLPWLTLICDTVGWDAQSLMYEDTAHQKVWIYNSSSNQPELMYDFSVHAGDTINYTGALLKIDSIDSVQLLNGEYRKRFNFGNPDGGGYNGFYVEGIGSMNGLFQPLFEFEVFWELMCVKYNNIPVFTPYRCANFVGVDELPAIKTMSVSPNPVREQFTISGFSPPFNHEIQIFNFLGEMIFSAFITESAIAIDVNSWPKGIYFIRTDSAQTLKVVKE